MLLYTLLLKISSLLLIFICISRRPVIRELQSQPQIILPE